MNKLKILLTIVDNRYIFVSMKTELTRVEKTVLDKARTHCKKNGLVLSWYVSNALKIQLKKEKK